MSDIDREQDTPPDGEDLNVVPKLPEVTDVHRYRYEPGDKIIIRSVERLDTATAVQLREIVSTVLEVPENDVLIMSHGLRLDVVSEGSKE